MPQPYRTVVDVHLILQRPDGRVLLAQRAGTGYADGQWGVPGGKLDADEDVITAAIREAHEELGVHVDPDDVQCVTVIHHRNPGAEGRVGFFFRTHTWKGEPHNAEPHKCSGITWADLEHLPDPMIGYSLAALRQLHPQGRTFIIDGWESATVGRLSPSSSPSSGKAGSRTFQA
jgi:8-oxo-dGTP diphosphatase